MTLHYRKENTAKAKKMNKYINDVFLPHAAIWSV